MLVYIGLLLAGSSFIDAGHSICGYNEILSDCKIVCPPQACESIYTTYLCEYRGCEVGCNCLSEHLRNSSGICVPSEQCFTTVNCTIPPECRQTCANPNPNCTHVRMLSLQRETCDCEEGFILSDVDGPCIKKEDCPKETKCGQNGTYSGCGFRCPNQYCPEDDSLTQVACKPGRDCPPGCQCKENYRRKSVGQDDVCILASDCPPVNCTRPNEVWDSCPRCLAERCDDMNTTAACTDKPGTNCDPKCVCAKGYYRNNDDVCVSAETCQSYKCGVNGTYSGCGFRCPNQYCPQDDTLLQIACKPGRNCPPGCQCNDNYRRKAYGEDDVCILASDCPPVNCTRPNEVWNPCSQCLAERCEDINKPVLCGDQPGTNCEPRCVCAKGFYRNKDDICVSAETCQSDKCGVNATYSGCGFRCPNQYCPQNDKLVKVACKPGRDCPPGCQCKSNYRRKSRGEDDVCILASDCPPVNCTRPNEIWNPCSQCLAERCEDINRPVLCGDQPDTNCDPRCVCANGYYRNKKNVCILAESCPGQCEVPIECRRTCAVPNPPNCDAYKIPFSSKEGCQCEEGYLLTEPEGKCIAVDNCPKMTSCNGDPHAVLKKCPLACPSTCSEPDAKPCEKMCEYVGCECEPGYILSYIGGQCVKVQDCPGGNPCGDNATYVQCKSSCPTDYCPVDDSRALVQCEYYPFSPCYSGCRCKLNNKRLKTEDPRCIASYDCPPVNCTRPNEVWSSCPSACLAEECADVDKAPSVCNTLVFNCDPRCVCENNYYRNSTGICVSAQKCREINASNNRTSE